MKRITYCVRVELKFKNLTLDEAHNLEVFMDGLTARDDWGEPEIAWNLSPMGEKEISKDKNKPVTAKKLLELEKEHSGKK